MGRLGILLLLGAAAATQDLPEDLPRKPLWRHSLAERWHRYHAYEGKWHFLIADREAAPTPARSMSWDMHLRYPANRPRVRDGLVLYKDGNELIVRRIGSGAFVECRRYESLRGSSRFPVARVRPGGEGRHEDIYRYRDYGGGAVTLGAGHVVAVEEQQLSDPSAWPYQGARNLLAVYDLQTWKTLWAWKRGLHSERVRARAFAAWNADYQAHNRVRFLEAGIVHGGTLHTLAVEEGAIHLWCIELESGVVESRTRIQQVPEKFPDSAPAGASLAYADGVVYVATHLGTVVAVDLARRAEPIWRFGYKSEDYGFALNRPLVVGKRLIVAACDADQVRAFDRKSGQLLWTFRPKSTSGAAHVVGVGEGVLVLAGKTICGVDLETGKVAWGPKGLDGSPFGRGFVGERHAHIPLTLKDGGSRIERFDVATGDRPGPLDFDVDRLGNLLFADGRLVVADDEEVMCFSTVERALQGPPLDRALVLALFGDPDEAADALEGAAKQGESARDLALHHLLRLALSRKRLDLADRAERLARWPAELAQVALVRACLTGDLEALAEHGETEVVFHGRVTTAAEAARALRR